MSSVRLLAFLLASVPVGHTAMAQGDRPATATLDVQTAAIAHARALYFEMDYEGLASDAAKSLSRFPSSRRLAAWHVAGLARSDRPIEAARATDRLLAANRNDPWGWFARALVFEYASESATSADALAASAEAYRRAPRDADVIWLRASILSTNGKAAEALALIDSTAARGPLPQELKTLRASAMYSLAASGPKVDAARRDSAIALFQAAQRADSTDASAFTFAASRLLGMGRNADAYTSAKRGVVLSPNALAAHQWLWRAIDGMKDRSQAARDSEALADVDTLVRARGNEPTVLLAASDQFSTRRRPEEARRLGDELISSFPTSRSAEWVLVNRYRALDKERRDTSAHDSTATEQYRAALWAFLDRPTHVSDRLVGDAYRQLFYLTDSTANADTLLRIVRGMVKYEGINPHIVYADGAIRLAQRGRDFTEAERIAHDGLAAGRARIDQQKNIYETVGDYARAQDWMASFMFDALGVVYMYEGKLDAAAKQLEHAHELSSDNSKVLYHLGQLAERRHRVADAERDYIKGSLISAPGENPNRAALKRLYQATRGSLDGYDAFLAGLAETDRAARKADILKSRAAKPTALASFRLRGVDGRTLSLDSLRGKILVINAWGMWCGPCVAEMPELQKLASQYAADSSVRILTIDNDPNTDELRTWLAKKGYTFTTLLDDGYLGRSDLHVFPTTWFVDPRGRKVFTKTGSSEHLAEEFAWRIEAIRTAPVVP